MSDRKSAKPNFAKRLRQLPQTAAKSMVTTLLRAAFVLNRRSRLAATGFVLPTVVLLVLVVTLTTGALVFRAFNSSTNTIASNQNRVIYNAATPAIDRARSKLEYLFDGDKDSRFPSGVPSEALLMSMLLNDGSSVKGASANPLRINTSQDPYNLPDEKRVDLNGDTKNDNAWAYRADTNGDGAPDATVVYSIVFSTPLDKINDTTKKVETYGWQRLVKFSDAEKAAGEIDGTGPAARAIPYVRSGPLSNASGKECGGSAASGATVESGWYRDLVSTSILRKNFQVDALVIPDKGKGGVTTLEFQQDRQLDSGNKWGAWFRNDLELNPGSTFQWNGAMHTEGSFLVGLSGFTAHLISSPNSCLYFPASNSEITVTKRDPDPKSTDADAKAGFQGLVMAASLEGTVGSSDIYIHSSGSGTPPNENLNPASDWSNLATADADKIILDDVKVKTVDGYRAKGTTSPTNDANRDLTKMPTALGGQKNDGINGRFRAVSEPPPYVDDLYRADDRYGPKYRYNTQIVIPAGKTAGMPILTTDNLGPDAKPADLIKKDRDAGGSSNSVGLDGYWERRARIQGLRVLVGERLDFGNTFGWKNASSTPALRTIDDDPLYPAYALKTTRAHEAKQRRSLRDNIAAVQGTAIYHAATANYDTPVACLASTAHPGTAETLERSVNFVPTKFTGGSTDGLVTDFFNGRGTNGWEFAPPDLSNISVKNALKNLGNYAGELDGAFPPKQESGKVHPDPVLTMWGNFSNLNRAMDTGGNGTNNSIADLTYKDTAACTLGMLAYNITELEKFGSAASSITSQTVTTLSGTAPTGVITGTIPRVMYSATLADVAKLIESQKASITNYNQATPEAILAAMRNAVGDVTVTSSPLTDSVIDARIRFAELIVTKAQEIRDRKYGFADSPAADVKTDGGVTYAYDSTPTGPKGLPDFAGLSALTTADQKTAILRLYGTVIVDPVDPTKSKIKPKWPFLYYLFRTGAGVTQPTGELYSSKAPSAVPQAVTVSDVALTPKGATWLLPRANTPAIDVRNTNPNRIVNTDGKPIAVGFLDKVMFDGRERMPARQMSIDLGLLRRSPVASAVVLPPSGALGGTEYGTKETWLPASGVVYAFREDGVREDAINRPANGLFDLLGNGGRTNAVPGSEADSTLGNFGISLKSVDFVADPDRRIHGFRLANGSHLRRVSGVDAADNIRGLSFFTDNPAAIMGDFNIHETVAGEDAKGTPLEEFNERLWNYVAGEAAFTPATFYSRKTRSSAFASNNMTTGDHWRPSEVLSDAAMIFSESLCEGSLNDTFASAGGGDSATITDGVKYNQPLKALYAPYCANGSATSFLNQNRPSSDPTTTPNGSYKWVRENPADSNSPVKISANGEPVMALAAPGSPALEYGKTLKPSSTVSFDYYDGTADRNVQSVSTQISDGADGHRINTILISGLVPARKGQYNGGLHNFLRFLENWQGGSSRALWFSGSFIQLNYSNYSTALYDQRTWDQPGTTTGQSPIAYYRQPKRYWGYDVALQLAPAGPAAARFVTVSKNRNEFYSEVPANDPYISKLCAAVKGAKANGTITTNGPINCPA